MAWTDGSSGHYIGADTKKRLDRISKGDKAHSDGRIHLHQDVHVAGLRLIAPGVGPEECQALHAEVLLEPGTFSTQDS